MENIAVESEIIFAGIQVNSIATDLVSHRVVGDVSNLVPTERDVMRVIIALDSGITAALYNETLDHDERSVVKIEVRGGTVAVGCGRRIHGVQNRPAAVLRHERDGI